MACTAAGWLQHVVEFLSFWVYRGMMLLSLAAHLALVCWSESRRREGRGWRRSILWLAYQLTDWAPSYVLSNLYLELTPHEKLPVAFWVPFLLLHLARPDNISAYVMEDSKLSKRSNAFVAPQIFGAIYVWYRYIYMDCTAGMLLPASIIMFLLGIFKYWESAVALRRCDMGRIRKSCNQWRPRYGDAQWASYSSWVFDYGGGEKRKLDDEEALLVAHKLFIICKCAFSDNRMDEELRDFAAGMFHDEWEFMCKVVEMELSLMYDIMYTKAALVHTWGGYALRVASPFLTAAALVLFGLHCREDQKPGDIGITYILLVTTFVLDVRWLVRALVSTWTHSFLKVRPQYSGSLNYEVLPWGRWQQLRRFVVSRRLSVWTCPKEPTSYRRWSGTVGRHNLFDECTRGRKSRLEKIPEPVKKRLFKNICRRFFRATSRTPDSGSPAQGGHCNRGSVGCTCDRVVPLHNCRYGHTGCTCDRVAPSDNCRYGHAGYTCDRVTLPDYCGHVHVGCTYDQVAPSDYCRHGHTGCMCDQVALPNHCGYNHGGCRSDQHSSRVNVSRAMGLNPELQKLILIWHIATNIFLHHSSKTAAAVSPSDDVKKIKEAIEVMSDYMMFLVAKRSNMLPGLKLCNLHEDSLDTLKNDISEEDRKTNKELAKSMLRNKDEMARDVVWEGARWAAAWIQHSEKLEVKLEYIFNQWVYLLIWASIRCSREAHAEQLGSGGELTTLIWMVTEHTYMRIPIPYT